MKILLQIAGLARSTYYYHVQQLKKPDKYHQTKKMISEIYHQNKGRYGYRRMVLALSQAGHHLNHKTVRKLLQELGLVCRVRLKKYKSYRGAVGKITPDRLQRNFTAPRPQQVWVSDVTEFSLFGEKIYLSPILDLYNGEIISYTISKRPNFDQVMTMLEKALAKRTDKRRKLTLHTDQGFHYQNPKFQQKLAQHRIKQSMSRKGNCLDNATMESFFGHLKSELLYLMDFQNIEHFLDELVDYLDYYNRKRIRTKLKGLSPVDYRTQTLGAA